MLTCPVHVADLPRAHANLRRVPLQLSCRKAQSMETIPVWAITRSVNKETCLEMITVWAMRSVDKKICFKP